MDNSTSVRDAILKNLKNDSNFNGMVATEVTGFHFSAADVALPNSNGEGEVFRISVIKHGQSKTNT